MNLVSIKLKKKKNKIIIIIIFILLLKIIFNLARGCQTKFNFFINTFRYKIISKFYLINL